MIAEQPELRARQEMWSRAERFTHLTYGHTSFMLTILSAKTWGGWRIPIGNSLCRFSRFIGDRQWLRRCWLVIGCPMYVEG